MHNAMYLPSLLLLTFSTLAQGTTSPKRGLIYVAPSTPADASDSQIFVAPGSDLTWYYNYASTPISAYSNTTQTAFEFVPMLFSAPSNTNDTSFLDGIKGLLAAGTNISHVLAFNEPDGTSSTGGSDMDPTAAAKVWINEIEPLRTLGIKAGAPAVTGSPGGFTWLSSFFDACAKLGTNCTADFIPIHWYGDFGGLASHLGQVVGT